MNRTYGETTNCAGCRYWSEMIAKAHGGGPVMAMCLAPIGTSRGKYTAGFMKCAAWESGHRGAVDEPGSDGTEYLQGAA